MVLPTYAREISACFIVTCIWASAAALEPEQRPVADPTARQNQPADFGVTAVECQPTGLRPLRVKGVADHAGLRDQIIVHATNLRVWLDSISEQGTATKPEQRRVLTGYQLVPVL